MSGRDPLLRPARLHHCFVAAICAALFIILAVGAGQP